MEQVPATGSTLMVSTSNTRVGIATATPQATLDVNGNLQVGSGVYKSTFAANPSATTYALQLGTGAKVNNGGAIELTTGGYLKWADGSISTSANSGAVAASTVFASSITQGFTSGTSATSLSVCYATQTITTSGGKVAVWYSGSLHNSVAANGCIVGFLEDGAYIAPYTNAIGHAVAVSHAANLPASASFWTLVRAPSAGAHSYCITLAALANTCTLSAFSYYYNEFGVMEFK